MVNKPWSPESGQFWDNSASEQIRLLSLRLEVFTAFNTINCAFHYSVWFLTTQNRQLPPHGGKKVFYIISNSTITCSTKTINFTTLTDLVKKKWLPLIPYAQAAPILRPDADQQHSYSSSFIYRVLPDMVLIITR